MRDFVYIFNPLDRSNAIIPRGSADSSFERAIIPQLNRVITESDESNRHAGLAGPIRRRLQPINWGSLAMNDPLGYDPNILDGLESDSPDGVELDILSTSEGVPNGESAYHDGDSTYSKIDLMWFRT